MPGLTQAQQFVNFFFFFLSKRADSALIEILDAASSHILVFTRFFSGFDFFFQIAEPGSSDFFIILSSLESNLFVKAVVGLVEAAFDILYHFMVSFSVFVVDGKSHFELFYFHFFVLKFDFFVHLC